MWPFKQRRKRVLTPLSPAQDPTSLGNLVLAEGLLTEDEFDELMDEFNDTRIESLLGRFLVTRGVITEEKLELLLIRQKAKRNGGVDASHIMEAMEIAEKAERRAKAADAKFLAVADVFINKA